MRNDDRGGGRVKKRRKPKPRRPPSPPSSVTQAINAGVAAAQPTVFTNPVTSGPALHQQRKEQRDKVRRAEERLPGPSVRLPRFPKLERYTPAQRRLIIEETMRMIREAGDRGDLDSYRPTSDFSETLSSRLGRLTDRETRAAIQKMEGAQSTRERNADVRLGRRLTRDQLLPVPPTLANLAAIGRGVRQQRLSDVLADQGEIKPGGTPTDVGHKLSGFLDDRLFTQAPNLRAVTTPLQLARATAEDPVGVGKATLRTAVESIAGIPQGIKAIVDDPGAALEAMGEDYKHRYGPLLEGDTARFREQVKEESGLTPFALDAAAVGAGTGQVGGVVARSGTAARTAQALARAKEPVLSRVLQAAHETATRQRPNLRFSGGEAGVRPQATSRNLWMAAAQRGVDTARQGAFRRRAERQGLRPTPQGRLERIPGEATSGRLAGLRPGADEVLPFFSPREGQTKRLTGRVARDVGSSKSKGRLMLLQRRGAALDDMERVMRRLKPEERAALFPAVKYGLPAIVDDASRAQALTAIERRLGQISRERKQSGFKGTPAVVRATNDEVALLRAIRRDPDRYLTPKTRAAADDLIAVQRREEALDPDLPAERALIRRDTEQGKLLGVRRGPDEEAFRGTLEEIELVRQASGKGAGGVVESHARLAALLPEARPAAAAKLEQQAKSRLTTAEKALGKAREELAEAKGRAQILSRNVTGTRAGERRATAGGGLGVARAQEAVQKAETAAAGARDAYAAAREVTAAVKSKRTMRLESAEAFDARVRKAAEEAGLSEPGYWMSTPRPVETYSEAAIGSGGRAAARSKRYTGSLSDVGIETNTSDVFIKGVERNIKRRFSWALVNRNMEVHAFEWSRGNRGEGLTASQVLKKLDEEHIDADSVSFINARVVRDRAPDETGVARGSVIDNAMAEDNVLREVNQDLISARKSLQDLKAEKVQGQALNRYLVVPREVGDELLRVTNPDGGFARAAEILLKQKPARILLGAFNVPWLSFQVASNAFLTGLGGGRNPLDIYGAHKWWRGLDDAEKAAMEIELGITHGRHFALDQTHLGSQKARFGPVEHFIDFWQGYKKSRVGRLGHKGNPLDLMFRADEAQNNFFRKVLFYSQAKKDAYKAMGANWKSLDGVHKKLMQALAVPPEKLGGVMTKQGPVFEKAAKTVNDFLGNYLTYSNMERQLLSRNVMFYGYLRFSIRFSFWTMPVEHPVMTAMLGNIGRLGADEIKQLFGVEDDYRLPTSMLARLYTGASPEDVQEYVESDGKRGKLPLSVNIGRMNPGLNAFTQLESGQQIIGLTSPLYQALVDQLFSESSFTGRDYRIKGQTTPSESQRPKGYFGSMWSTFIPGRPRNRILLSDLLGLIYPYRVATNTGTPGLGVNLPIVGDNIPLLGRQMDPLEGPQSDDSLLWSPRPMKYKDKQIKKSIGESIERERESGRRGIVPQLFPFTPQEDLGPVVIGREREKEADAADRSTKKKKRKKAGYQFQSGRSGYKFSSGSFEGG